MNKKSLSILVFVTFSTCIQAENSESEEYITQSERAYREHKSNKRKQHAMQAITTGVLLVTSWRFGRPIKEFVRMPQTLNELKRCCEKDFEYIKHHIQDLAKKHDIKSLQSYIARMESNMATKYDLNRIEHKIDRIIETIG